MDLIVATHFEQGQDYAEHFALELLQLTEQSGASGIRDGITWAIVEKQPGVYDFSNFRTNYMAFVDQHGLDVTLTLQPHGNALYDDGDTVTSEQGVDGFAQFVEALLDEFPSVKSIVIGNEFNGNNTQFVSGEAATRSVAQRADYYTEILAGVSETIAETHSDVSISGGALHSIATGYVAALIESGAFEYMDSLDLHPYGLDPVEVGPALDRLNDLLATLPQDQVPDLVVTEFGRSADLSDPLSNSDYLGKMVAVMAAGGVSEAAWYALLDEDWASYRDMGLYDKRDTPNDMLSGFQFVQSVLANAGAITDVEIGPGIKAYDFGNGTWAVWGSSQEVTITGGNLVVRDASGTVIDVPDRIDDGLLYLQGRNIDIDPKEGAHALLADSFYDWRLEPTSDGPLSYHMLTIANGTETEKLTQVMDGQTWFDEPWNPYLGDNWSRPFWMKADTVLPVAFGTSGNNDRASLERFTVSEDGAIDLVGSWSVSDNSVDGVIVEVRHNGEVIATQAVTSDSAIAVRGLEVAVGDEIDFVVHDGANSTGDVTTRHIRIFEADPTLSNEALVNDHLAHDLIEGSQGTTVRVIDHAALDDGSTTHAQADPRNVIEDVSFWFESSTGTIASLRDLYQGAAEPELIEAGDTGVFLDDGGALF